MRRKKAFFWFTFITFTIGGLYIPQLGFGTSHIPPVQNGVSISVQIGEPAPPPPPSPTSSVGILPYPFLPPPSGKLIVRGFAPPFSFLSVLKNKSTAATVRVDAGGFFEAVLESVSGEVHEFSFFAEDLDGFVSQSVVLSSIPIFSNGTTTLENIFIPPTLSVDTPEVEENQRIRLHGFTIPDASVHVFFSPLDTVRRVTSAKDGRWEVSLPASELPKGSYRVRAQAQSSTGFLSDFSAFFDLKVLSGVPLLPPPPPIIPPQPIPPSSLGVDVNGDAKVDLIDLSILLSHWGSFDARVDFNKDQIIDLIDASILFFWWS